MIAALGGGAVATGWVILVNALSYAAPILTLRRLDQRALLDARAERPASPVRSGRAWPTCAAGPT